MKLNKVLLNIASVISFIFGAFYIFSLVFIPVGIYCFTAGKRFSYKADHLLDNYAVDKKVLYGYSIFVSVVCFPLGLIALIAYLRIYSNNIKVETAENSNLESDKETIVQDNEIDIKTESSQTNVQEETEEEKMEKLEKLRKFKEKGIITEDEFEMARKQMFAKDKE